MIYYVVKGLVGIFLFQVVLPNNLFISTLTFNLEEMCIP